MDRYGNRKIVKMYNEMNRLRAAIQREGTPAIQAAWDDCEEWIDFAFQQPAPQQEKA